LANNLIIPGKVRDGQGRIFEKIILGEKLFNGTSLTGNLTFSEGVIQINNDFFGTDTPYSSLNQLFLPNSLKGIGTSAFAFAKINNII
jgi:hypothetical protein